MIRDKDNIRNILDAFAKISLLKHDLAEASTVTSHRHTYLSSFNEPSCSAELGFTRQSIFGFQATTYSISTTRIIVSNIKSIKYTSTDDLTKQ